MPRAEVGRLPASALTAERAADEGDERWDRVSANIATYNGAVACAAPRAAAQITP
jgi:hypothetical protein